jgi:sugar phosphate isomerase/epimerase
MEIGFTAGPKPVEEYFKFAAINGFQRLDLGCSAPVNFPQMFNEERIQRVKEQGKKWEIKYGLHTSSYVNTAEIMPDVREASERHLLNYIKLSKEIGAEYCVVHCGYHFSQFRDVVMESLFKTYRAAVELAEEIDLPLVIENMNHVHPDSEIVYLGVTIEEINQLFDAVPSEKLGLAFDVAHANLLPGGTQNWIDAFPDKIFHLHLSDNDGVLDRHLPIGDGSIDFNSVFSQLDDIGFSGTATLEVGSEANNIKSLEVLRNILGDAKTPETRSL